MDVNVIFSLSLLIKAKEIGLLRENHRLLAVN